MSDEALAAHTGITWNGHVGTVQYGGGDRTMVAMFYTKAFHHPGKSAEAGHPIYEDRIFVKIHPPGERLNIVDRPATVQDQRRFPTQWMQFKENHQQIPDGTPVDLLYNDQPSIAAMLRGHGVHTVEQLSELSAPAIENIGMGCQTYVNNAVKYLQMANKGVNAAQYRKESEDKDRQIYTLTKTIEKLQEQINRISEKTDVAVTPEMFQQFVASMQGRPTFPQGAPKQMAQPFDAATAQINATSPSSELARSKKRPRARIQG